MVSKKEALEKAREQWDEEEGVILVWDRKIVDCGVPESEIGVFPEKSVSKNDRRKKREVYRKSKHQ